MAPGAIWSDRIERLRQHPGGARRAAPARCREDGRTGGREDGRTGGLTPSVSRQRVWRQRRTDFDH
jgi:hypothetical protein